MDIQEIEQFILDAGSDSLAVFGGAYEGGAHIQQVPDEIARCILALLESGESIKSYLEIGVAAGGTTFVLNHFFGFEKIVLIDDNGHPKHRLRGQILKDVQREEIIGNSHMILPDILTPRMDRFDLIVIDGDHSYKGVKADFEHCLPMLNKGGFLVFHDTAHRLWGCDVPEFVGQLESDERVELVGEYISTKRMPCGLALFRKVAE
ncbi:MAG: hypothetical protein A4E65_02312 [Syntrophorhabdus sp. PtaU1.Bin153]|nr:MAG: hypothetical protein A4E65_02312 [Syntrophorhabdus sp. PtaU1.Bin153]